MARRAPRQTRPQVSSWALCPGPTGPQVQALRGALIARLQDQHRCTLGPRDKPEDDIGRRRGREAWVKLGATQHAPGTVQMWLAPPVDVGSRKGA